MIQSTGDQYAQSLMEFLTQRGLNDASLIVDVFHAVRTVPYGSRGGRSAASVIQNNEGSCSGKHILLRDALRHLKQRASVETVKGDFAAAMPAHPTMPDELQVFCKEGGIVDFHHYVVWEGPIGEVKLDATWSDGPIARGVPGNQEWDGRRDTVLALEPEVVLDRAEDISDYKNRLLQQLSQEETVRRERFLALLTDWVVATEYEGEI